MIARLLREEPSEEVIDAVSRVADEECIVLLGRIARSKPALSDAALDALESIDHHRASAMAIAIRGQRLPPEARAEIHQRDAAPFGPGEPVSLKLAAGSRKQAKRRNLN